MANNITQERVRWVMPIYEGRTTITEVMKVFPYGRRTLERWLAAFRQGGAAALGPKSTRPKTSPKETPIALKEAVIALRKKKKVCALKLHWKLEKQGIRIHERTIGKILKMEGLVRKYRTKKVSYKYIRATWKPGELVEIDVKHVPGTIAGKAYFQYTAIDCASRWRYLRIFEEECTMNTLVFLEDVIARFPHQIMGVKTDNHSTFTNRYTGTYKRADLSPAHQHALDAFCADHGIVHYLIDPGKPSQNGKVERSHGSDQRTVYDTASFASAKALRQTIRRWNTEYNNLEHCGLEGKTPNEILAEFKPS